MGALVSFAPNRSEALGQLNMFPPKKKPVERASFVASLPNELIRIIAGYTSLAAKLALADTCSDFRALVETEECTVACIQAGLSMSKEASPRAMAKLLCQPRVGVCNWSLEGGVPKRDLQFADLWTTSAAIKLEKACKLHPTFVHRKYFSFGQRRSQQTIRLRVAKDQEIFLFKNRLYANEYLTYPPLKDVRCSLRDPSDQWMGRDSDWDLEFVIKNPRGVTLGNFFEGFYNILKHLPHHEFVMANEIAQWRQMPREAVDRLYPTNLTLLNKHYSSFNLRRPQKFSKHGLYVERSMTAEFHEIHINSVNPMILKDTGDDDESKEWGRPLASQPSYDDEDCERRNEHWRSMPIIQF